MSTYISALFPLFGSDPDRTANKGPASLLMLAQPWLFRLFPSVLGRDETLRLHRDLGHLMEVIGWEGIYLFRSFPPKNIGVLFVWQKRLNENLKNSIRFIVTNLYVRPSV